MLTITGIFQPEGETIYKTKSMFVDLRTQSLFEKQLTLEIPKNVISGSEYIEVSVIGKSRPHGGSSAGQVFTSLYNF